MRTYKTHDDVNPNHKVLVREKAIKQMRKEARREKRLQQLFGDVYARGVFDLHEALGMSRRVSPAYFD